jgi:hypothetical protein
LEPDGSAAFYDELGRACGASLAEKPLRQQEEKCVEALPFSCRQISNWRNLENGRHFVALGLCLFRLKRLKIENLFTVAHHEDFSSGGSST